MGMYGWDPAAETAPDEVEPTREELDAELTRWKQRYADLRGAVLAGNFTTAHALAQNWSAVR